MATRQRRSCWKEPDLRYSYSGFKRCERWKLETIGSGNAFKAEDFIGYDYSEDETAHYYENGKKVSVEELFTDKKGFVRSPELPYGKYVVFESTTPENLQTINPFLVTITEDRGGTAAMAYFLMIDRSSFP